jgi:hypothetical protein
MAHSVLLVPSSACVGGMTFGQMSGRTAHPVRSIGFRNPTQSKVSSDSFNDASHDSITLFRIELWNSSLVRM